VTGDSAPMERLKNPKLLAALVLAALALVVFLQNREPVVLEVLFLAKVSTTLATALVFAFLAGAITGALAWSLLRSQRRKSSTGGVEPS